MHFQQIDHFETLPVLAQLHKLTADKGLWTPYPGDGSARALVLRAHKGPTEENWPDDLPCHDGEAFGKWVSLRRLLAAAKKSIARHPVARLVDLSAPLGRVMVVDLPAGAVNGWHRDEGAYHARHQRFHICLTSNPGCLCYAEAETVCMIPGWLYWMNMAATHSVANWGRSSRYHVIFDLPAPTSDDD